MSCLLSKKVSPHNKYFRVVFVLSGANIDMTVLGRTLERALALEGRIIKAKVQIYSLKRNQEIHIFFSNRF